MQMTFYGTGDECYELWSQGVDFYKHLNGCVNSATLKKRLLSWLKRSAQLSKRDYKTYYGDPDNPLADKVTIELDGVD